MRFSLKLFSILALTAMLAFSLTSCDPEDVDPNPGTLKVQVEYVFGVNQIPWQLNMSLWHPRTGDSLVYTTFKFYISNVRLLDSEGNWWAQPESYHLIDAVSSEASSFTITDIPAGDYVEMEYLLGIDEAHNMGGTQTGALDPANGMFWNFTDGYIMLKIEGLSPNSSEGTFTFHLGGYSGVNDVTMLKNTNFFNETITINEDQSPVLFMKANTAKPWHNSPSVSVVNTITTPGADAKVMADDFFGAFTPSRVEK